MNPFKTVNPFKKFVVPRPDPEPEIELSEVASHLHVDPNGGEVVNNLDKPRSFNDYDDIPF